MTRTRVPSNFRELDQKTLREELAKIDVKALQSQSDYTRRAIMLHVENKAEGKDDDPAFSLFNAIREWRQLEDDISRYRQGIGLLQDERGEKLQFSCFYWAIDPNGDGPMIVKISSHGEPIEWDYEVDRSIQDLIRFRFLEKVQPCTMFKCD